VSVIIVVKNDRGIQTTLQHLSRIGRGIRHEVIIVDASEPGILADIRSKFPSVRWHQFPPSAKRTTPQQRNVGLRLAGGDIIAFIDANCTPADTWFTAMISQMAAGKDIVCGPVLDSSEGNMVHYAPSLAEGAYVDVCTTISVGLRREVVERIGAFDPSFSFGQDVDFFWRATDAGYRIYYDPQFAIWHDWGDSKEQLKRAFEYGKARAHLFKKHWPRRWKQLRYEPHVWAYPLFILGLPLTSFIPFYPLLILLPVVKNLTHNPLGLILHHFSYGLGVIAGALMHWPKAPSA
jgi:cellulose synthase/poly-beta-1,6-N-acetylglucosamine synthase-like glycosyltransferase